MTIDKLGYRMSSSCVERTQASTFSLLDALSQRKPPLTIS